jgi:predicted phage tail protein
MSVTDLADDTPGSVFNRALQWVPRILSSKPHIVWLMALGVYLIVLPLLGVAVSAKSELIGGNYTNVTSDIGACIAAGGTLHLVSQGRKRQKAETERQRIDAERLTLLKEVHALLHHLHPDAAAAIGQAVRQAHEDQARQD